MSGGPSAPVTADVIRHAALENRTPPLDAAGYDRVVVGNSQAKGLRPVSCPEHS